MYTSSLLMAALAAATSVNAALPLAFSSSTGMANGTMVSNSTSSSSTGRAAVAPVVTTSSAPAPTCNLQFAASSKDAIWAIANQQRLFQQHNLEVCFTAVTNVGEAYQNLLSGQYDVLSAQLDSVLDRYINAGNNITVLGGLDGNPALALYSVADITTPEQLYGKVIAVSEANSGFEYAIEKILLLYGVQPGTYGFLPVGNTETRLTSLQNGNYSGNTIHATLLTSPYSEIETLALQSNTGSRNVTAPLNKLATVSDYIPAYQGDVLVVNRPILSNSSKVALLTNFTLVQLQARQILEITANKNLVVKSIMQEFNVTNTTAQAIYTAALNPDSGYLFNANLQIFQDQLLTPTYLRQQFNGFSGHSDLSSLLVQGSTGLVDYVVRDAALNLLYAKNTYANPVNASSTTTGVYSGGIASNDTTATTKQASRTFY